MFILVAEVLAKIVRNNKSIRGFSLGNDEVKISQYADDTTLILDGSEKSLTSAIQILDDFGNEQILVSGKKSKWPKYNVKTLGLRLNYNEKK